MNKVILFVLFFVSIGFSSVYGQYTREEETVEKEENEKKEEEKAEKKDKRENPLKKISIGGNFGFLMNQFGGSLYLAPKIGYEVKPWFRPGINLHYQYRWANFSGTRWNDHVYGGGVFLHFILLKRILLMVDYEILNTYAYPGGLAEPFRTNVNMLWLGVGYNQPMGKVGYFSVSLMYDVLNHPYSPYRQQYILQNPTNGTRLPLILRIGFGFGL